VKKNICYKKKYQHFIRLTTGTDIRACIDWPANSSQNIKQTMLPPAFSTRRRTVPAIPPAARLFFLIDF